MLIQVPGNRIHIRKNTCHSLVIFLNKSIRWLLGTSRKRPGRNMAFKLSSELVDSAKESGDAMQKKKRYS